MCSDVLARELGLTTDTATEGELNFVLDLFDTPALHKKLRAFHRALRKSNINVFEHERKTKVQNLLQEK